MIFFIFKRDNSVENNGWLNISESESAGMVDLDVSYGKVYIKFGLKSHHSIFKLVQIP